MTSIVSSVGIRNRVQQVANAVLDQTKILGLLSLIKSIDGGKAGVWNPPPLPGPAGRCPSQLADAIRGFQEVWRTRGDLRTVDGVVDPDGATLRKLDALVSGQAIIPGSVDPARISLRQTNPANLTVAHDVTQMVISPVLVGGLLQEFSQTGSIQELLFEMRKDGAVYWIGAAVPRGTTEFSKVQVFFHPTVVQGGVTHAADGDYATFRGGWPAHLQRYVAMQGGQLAAVRRTPLIVPFMTMAANTGTAPHYMFATKSTETLSAIMTAVRDTVVPGTAHPVQVTQIGVSSFSSGIGAMRLFIQTFNSGQIVETTDFDGPFIIAEPKTITRSPGAVGRVFSQTPPRHPEIGYQYLPAAKFRNISKFRAEGVHAQIGWMMFGTTALTSVIT